MTEPGGETQPRHKLITSMASMDTAKMTPHILIDEPMIVPDARLSMKKLSSEY